VKHYSEEDLMNFAKKSLEKNEMDFIERHLEECPGCFMKYDFLKLKLGVKSHVKYETIKAQKKPENCLSEEILTNYLAGEVSEKEKQQIENHLYCCKKCPEMLLNIDMIDAPSLWQSMERIISCATDWIKGITFVPAGLEPVMGTKGADEKNQETIKVYEGDEINIEIPVKKDGYLTVIHWNGEDLSPVIPGSYDSKTFIKSGETKSIEFTAHLPAGLQQIRAFITEEKLLNPDEIEFGDKKSIHKKLQDFIEKLEKLDKDKWSQQIKNYEVRKLDN